VLFYRYLIPKFAEIEKPLTELTRKDVFSSDQVLAYPDFNSQFILTTEASKMAAAAILSQVQNGAECPIAFASWQMNTAE